MLCLCAQYALNALQTTELYGLVAVQDQLVLVYVVRGNPLTRVS